MLFWTLTRISNVKKVGFLPVKATYPPHAAGYTGPKSFVFPYCPIGQLCVNSLHKASKLARVAIKVINDLEDILFLLPACCLPIIDFSAAA